MKKNDNEGERERESLKENEENYRQRLVWTSLNCPPSRTGRISIREACRGSEEKRGRDSQNK